MGNHESRRDLSRALGALTPPAPQVTPPPRGAQNSGLFDLGALYAAELEKAIVRARQPRQAPPPLRAVDLARSLGGLAPVAKGIPSPAESVWDVDAEDEDVHILSAGRARPLARLAGWFGITVTWLATVTLGFAVATVVPAHARTFRSALAVAATPPATPAEAVASPSPVQPPAQSGSHPTGAPVVSPQDPPPAASSSPASTKEAPLAKKMTPAPVAAPASPARVHPAQSEATPKAAAPARATSAPAPAGPVSLDDLIRRTVEAESKKKKP